MGDLFNFTWKGGGGGLLRGGAPKGANTVLLFVCRINIKKRNILS